jgi:hypothetical protein
MPRAIEVPPEVIPLLVGGGDGWKLRIIGDMFQAGERNKFFDHCWEFADQLERLQPFAEPNIRSRIQIDACFTPTPAEGMFECRKESERRVYGNPDRVREYLELHDLRRRRNDLVLVLMNFPERGGAGEHGNDNIAWTTPIDVIDKPSGQILENWYDVALHELGHAFDLDDEYEQPWPGAPDKPHNRNVCRSPEEAPWKDRLDSPDSILRFRDRRFDTPNWVLDYPTPSELNRFKDTKVGLFQGARYSSEDFWRSSLQCKMRSATQPFCGVCQSIISEKILTNG